MRFGLLLALLLALLPGLAAAAPLTVRSGEHAGFTRLVVPLPEGAEVRLSQVGRAVTLRIAGVKGFDLAEVYRLIPRDRIAGMRSAGDRLVLALGCDCRAASFRVGAGFLVLDVGDRGQALAGRSLAYRAPRVTLPEKAQEVVEALPPLGRAPLAPGAREVLAEAQERLARELGTAASQGLLEANAPLPLAPAPRPQVRLEALPAPPALASTGREEPPPQLRVSSAMDLPEGLAGLAQGGLSGARCLPEAALDPAQWSDGQPLAAQLGVLRPRLYGELDRLDPEAARALARLYLSAGFGAEARQLLALLPDPGPEAAALIAIAEIFEEGAARRPEALFALRDCPGAQALWALLAPPTLPKEIALDSATAQRALSALPLHLRQILAPGLAERLRAYGDRAGAARALRSLSRQADPLSPAARLEAARLALAADPEGEMARLEAILAEGGEAAPEALILLVEARLTADLPLTPERAELAAAYARELAGSPLGARLARARVQALIQANLFGAARATLAGLSDHPKSPEARVLRGLLLSRLTARGDDISFLEWALEDDAESLEELPPAEVLAVAERLLTLGFAGGAQAALRTLPEAAGGAARAHLAARVALALGQPFRARAELLGLEDETAQALRAEASARAGDHAGALATLAEATPEARRSAWLAGQWDHAALAEAARYGPVADLAQRETPPVTVGEGMLGRTEAALAESARSRAALEALLAPLPAAAGD